MSQRRQQILSIAEALLLQRGLRKMTISAIAQQADIAVGTVYLEFRSKDEIIAALTRAKLDLVLRAMRRASMSAASHEQRLYDIFWARTKGFLETAQETAHMQYVLDPRACEIVSDLHAEFERKQYELLYDFLDASDLAQAPAPSDVDDLTLGLLIATQSFMPPQLFCHHPAQLHGHFDALMRLLLSPWTQGASKT